MSERDVSLRCKYKLKGLCCPNCSMKIEKALSKEESIGETTINFANQTVWLPPHAEERARQIIQSIEPNVVLTLAEKSKKEQHDGHSHAGVHHQAYDDSEKRRLPYVIVSGALFVIGIILSSLLEHTQLLEHTTWRILEYAVFLTAYVLVGYPVLLTAGKNLIKGSLFDENFLMSIATLGAIAINEMPEAVGVMLFYSIGEYFQDRAVNKSRRSIQALLDIRPDSANLVQEDGQGVIKVSPETVKVGQIVLVRPGEKIPLDGEVVEGSSFLDTTALTGESVPRRVGVGDSALAGMINKSGVLKMRVTKPYTESSVAKILDLVENAGNRKARTEKFITKFARYYTPVIVFLALGIAFLPPLFGLGDLSVWVYRALTILVISCPCALVISIPLGYFGGIGCASKLGILIKGANYLEALTKVEKVVFDKTGTLTEGIFEVVEICPAEHFSQEELIEIGAMAESHSSHPIATSIKEKYNREIPTLNMMDYQEIPGYGIVAKINDRDVVIGKVELLIQKGIAVPDLAKPASHLTAVYVAVNRAFAGVIYISDRIKDGAKETISKLKQLGIKTAMLTGDRQDVAESIGNELKIKECYGGLLPEDKLSKLEGMMDQKSGEGKICFIGDGINDAPVISRADIGIAMGGLGADAAIEAADVVFMDDQPKKLISALEVARFTKKIIWENIVFALVIKLAFITLGIFGLSNMWEAVFADVGVALLAILNAMRIYNYSAKIKIDPISIKTEQ